MLLNMAVPFLQLLQFFLIAFTHAAPYVLTLCITAPLSSFQQARGTGEEALIEDEMC